MYHLLDIRTLGVILVLILILMIPLAAGFTFGCACMAVVGLVVDPQLPAPRDIVEMVAILLAPNVATFFLYRKVWSAEESWQLLGYRRRLWQTFIFIAYGFGAGSVILLVLSEDTLWRASL